MSYILSPEVEQMTAAYGGFLCELDRSPGSEVVLQRLITLEAQIRDHVRLVCERRGLPGPGAPSPITDEQAQLFDQGNRVPAERSLIDLASGHPQSIDDLLQQLVDRLYQTLQITNIAELCQTAGIFLIEQPETILPPDNLPGPTPGNGGNLERPESFPKLQHLLALLRDHEVYTDDLLIIRGQLQRNQMRSESYSLIEIPRLHRSVMLCNAYGEASFVVQGILGRNFAFSLTKSQLQDQFSGQVTRISYNDERVAEWSAAMEAALFSDLAGQVQLQDGPQPPPPENPPGEKVDVRTQEQYRQEILKSFPTPESWMSLTNSEKLQVKIFGKGLSHIASCFGPGGKPIANNRDMASLGTMIYGEGFEIFESAFWTPEEWAVRIKKSYPTPESWMALNNIEKQALNFFGHGLRFFSGGVFNTGGNPNYINRDMALLGRVIYGEGHVIIESAFWTPEEWAVHIKKSYPTPESWMGIPTFERNHLNLYGKGLQAIASIFGVMAGDKGYDSQVMGHLGRAIYGSGHEVIEYAFWTPEEWTAHIKKSYPTPESWMSLTQVERKGVNFFGRGLRYLARIVYFTEGNPLYSSKYMASLAKYIYGDGHEIIECEFWTPGGWANYIKREYPSFESFVTLFRNERHALRFLGYGIQHLAGHVFLTHGNPVSRNEDMRRLAIAIYGE